MATASARVPVLMTEAEKSRIHAKAKQAGLSTGEFMRRAAESYWPAEDDRTLEAMIGQMLESTARAERAIDGAIAFVAASNARIAALDAKGAAD